MPEALASRAGGFALSTKCFILSRENRALRAHGKGCRMRQSHQLKDNEPMTGIQYVTDQKGRKVAVQIDL